MMMGFTCFTVLPNTNNNNNIIGHLYGHNGALLQAPINITLKCIQWHAAACLSLPTNLHGHIPKIHKLKFLRKYIA